MKRKFLLLMLALIAMATTARSQVVLNETNFPDANFRAALATILGISEGDEITDAMIQQTTELDVSEKSIADLTGIEHFTALRELYCNENRLTSLDVSKNTKLTDLSCDNNQLTLLDVSNNTALEWLYCNENRLTSLDVSKNTKLTDLSCHHNQLTLLDVSQNTALQELYCYENRLTSLDVSKNTALTRLECRSNRLTSLDVSKNTALKELWCNNNQLTSLDVSRNTALTNLGCFSNQIKGEAMDALVASLPTVESGRFYVINIKDENEGNVCTKAQVAVAKGKGWKVYDYNGGNYPYPEYEGSDDAAAKLLLNAENFPDANFRKALASILKISEGDEITAEKIAATTSLSVNFYRISDLTGIEHFTALERLYCYDNQLTTLDVSKNTVLTLLRCYNNQLTALDVSQNTALTELRCDRNQLTALDVSKNTALTSLNCYNNQLTFLDVSGCTALTGLYCYSNQIKGEAMDALVASLPTVESGQFYVINTKDENESNVCTKAQVAVAKEKGWTVYGWNGRWADYEGCDPVATKLLLNAENFPDANFRAALAEELGISEGDEITEAKIAATTTLYVSRKEIADLTGIEHFTALRWFLCSYNQLTTLDVSKNTALTYLNCYGNQLTTLDVSKNTALTRLDCSWNQLALLDVSQNTALEDLSCGYNQLTSLDVSKNTALTDLSCNKNQLTSLDLSKNTALTGLECIGNQLTLLDVSQNTALEILECDKNQLISLDISQNIALTWLECSYNQLTSLDVSNNIALTELYCHGNQLTSLDVSKNTALKYLWCYSNQIKGEVMDALVASLPTVTSGEFIVIDTKDENEGNVCTKSQVSVAKEKGWTVYDYNDNNRQEYEGSDPVSEDIDPVDEDDNIDFGSDMDENSDLDGNVIGDIYYNINTGNGGYNAEEGCIVLKKTTDDETVDGLSGKDIFGEDFKGQFTGIVFKVPSGKGTVKVTAETTGNMLLKVKIGNNDPVEMELNGKLKISFPYNVSETTFVAIYAGANNEAKGFGAPASGDAALKIYGIEFIRDNTPTDINSVDSGELTVDSWYSIDGKKLAGDPKEKGIYIRNGRKVVK